MRALLIPVFLLAAFSSAAQKLKKEDKQLLTNLQTHVAFLSADGLQGRRTGTQGERLAAEYISGLFKMAGLQPKGTDGYLQHFEINEGLQVNRSTHFFIEGNELQLHRDFFPLTFSGNGSVTAMPSPALQEAKEPWFLDVKDMLDAATGNPHFDLQDEIASKAGEYHQKGATAVIVYNSGGAKDGLQFGSKAGTTTLQIPVMYLQRDVVKKYLSDPSAAVEIKLKVDIGPKTRKGMNVIGYLDNGAASTIVLGAHFDHLGMGEDGNSLYKGGPAQVHNGADDNASGTAALIELARLIKAKPSKTNNYLFIAFSGEELGLYGSKYFVNHPTIDLKSVNYMVNMDMLGRLNASVPVVTVGGYGTSPAWSSLFNEKSKKKKLVSNGLQFRFDNSGAGPSDHTSFYLKDIPVLFYFTGLHTDYHKPSDDADKINYNGELLVVQHIFSLLQATEKFVTKLPFTKTSATASGTTAKFTVSLGIMPDYTFDKGGVLVEAVLDDRPAKKAGMVAGDIITGLGTTKVTSIETYMDALSQFKKGDKTNVQFTRKGQSQSAAVEF